MTGPTDGPTRGPADGPTRGPADGARPTAAGGAEGAAALARATRALQDEPEPAWAEVAERLRDRLRGVSRPGRPLLLREDDAGVLRVDERVLVDTVRRQLLRVPGCRPVGVAVETAGPSRPSVERVAVQVWARYGTDVREVAEAARAATTVAVEAVLGPGLGSGLPVDVEVVDVELPAR